MTSQWFERFKKRFKFEPNVWHSNIKIKEKIKIWNSIAKGNASIVVGARSSLFLPYKNLGLIVIDEEHDQSFKQEEGVIYNARDMAIVRAKKTNIPIILCSATLSIETKQNIIEKKYESVKLLNRFGDAKFPKIEIIDLTEDPPKKNFWLSGKVHSEIHSTLESKNQVLIFLNRRGFAPYIFCNKCGKKTSCHNCDIGLVYHKKINSLLCHHCGLKKKIPDYCDNCKEKNNFYFYGPGVERIAEELREKYKDYKTEILTSDVMAKKNKGNEIIKKFEKEEINIIIGTQILAKGHHFPKLTLVVVVDSDIGYFGGDLRAAEKTFQLLMQVAGRSGRASLPGKVLIQSTMPENIIFKNIVNFNSKEFYNDELNIRKKSNLPPFKKLCLITIIGKNEKKLNKFCFSLKKNLQPSEDFEVLGPAPPYISFIRGKHRKRFIIRSKKNKNLQQFIKKWISRVKIPFDIKTYIDIDPYNFS